MTEQLRPPMEVRFTCEDAQLYMERLIRSCETLQSLDSGNYPLRFYSSGEIAKRIVNKEGKVIREEYAELPIFRPDKGIEKGLRLGVCYAIFSDLSMLKEMGVGQEAKDIVDLYRRAT
jgi:hypothetical protein